MSVKPIIILKEQDFFTIDTILRKPCDVITDFDNELQKTIKDLIDTMNSHRIAVGLSAPQIGISSCVSVVNTKKKEGKEPLILVNPKILNSSSQSEIRMEACMSLPFFQGEVERSSKISIAYQDPTGAKKQLHAEGFLARVLLHELDHLEGVLYVDRMLPNGKLVPADFFKNDS